MIEVSQFLNIIGHGAVWQALKEQLAITPGAKTAVEDGQNAVILTRPNQPSQSLLQGDDGLGY